MQKKMILSRQEIQARVKELGRTISGDYQDGKLVMIGVLNGAFVFMADLVRTINLELEVDFIRVASYGRSASSSGRISLSKDVEIDLAGKNVLLVEDIIDTGRTLSYLKDYFRQHRTASVKICALIDKKERREVEIAADYVGFEVNEGFLVGYGLDFAEQYRQFADVFHLENPDG